MFIIGIGEMEMRARYGERITKYAIQRKIICGECGKHIERTEPRYEAELEWKDTYNSYWTNANPNRKYELSRLVCEDCKDYLTSRTFGMVLE